LIFLSGMCLYLCRIAFAYMNMSRALYMHTDSMQCVLCMHSVFNVDI
jgi:hypothetical protein